MPYTFPHESRAEMLAYLFSDDRSRHHGVFQWCIKVGLLDLTADALAPLAKPEGYTLDAAEDDAWQDECEDDSERFWNWCEDGLRHVVEGDWCSYSGDDQGDWKFHTDGRTGGWLVLQSWRGHPIPRNPWEALAWAEELSEDDLTAFYRGIRTADSDFTREAATAEVMHYAAYDRGEWEATRRENREAEATTIAAEIEESRPDLRAFA